MHTIFDTAGTQYVVARRRLDDRSIVYTVHVSDELVARAVFPAHAAEVVERGVRNPLHGGSAPRSARASARNSASLPLISRSSPSTSSRNQRRTAARWLVTWVTGIPCSRASWR